MGHDRVRTTEIDTDWFRSNKVWTVDSSGACKVIWIFSSWVPQKCSLCSFQENYIFRTQKKLFFHHQPLFAWITLYIRNMAIKMQPQLVCYKSNQITARATHNLWNTTLLRNRKSLLWQKACPPFSRKVKKVLFFEFFSIPFWHTLLRFCFVPLSMLVHRFRTPTNPTQMESVQIWCD